MPGVLDEPRRELYEFGPFRVDADKEELFRDGLPVPLTPKAFQILLVLVRRGGEIASKDEIMKAVWPDTFVEETNLTRNISASEEHWGKGRRTSTFSRYRERVTGWQTGLFLSSRVN